MKHLNYLFAFIFILINSSCLNRQFVDGQAEFVSISEAQFNDSVQIFGYVYRVGMEDNYNYIENEFEIWLENSGLNTTSDTTGFYSIQTTPGTYRMKCQHSSNKYERLLVEFDTDEIPKNKKMQVDFYIGTTIE